MTYAMALMGVGALLLSTPALAAPSHGKTLVSTSAITSHDNARDDDRARTEAISLLDGQMRGILHNPHCDPDDQGGPDGDHDDRAAHNPGRGRHLGRCVGRPASP